ncbi:fucose 4-O-acetylase-like acetyltransferase [Nocardiopsis mwathae]|uniref:Fucose 4-O-acetylase-like acetyltransferase n=1 Tax=Nocardiopsis mwathae TaxID=1472723 RepID=A0A7W9YDU6_9ACTN|nr:fucose 4-O-acetylase-like acetyltransferase [Nocardiopsis mwathae]
MASISTRPSEPEPEPGDADPSRKTPEGRKEPPPQPRDALLDNAKFLLILLVVIGHVIAPTTETREANAVYFWIYLFHMPAFALISGYLSKSFDGSPARIDRLLATVAAPYLVFWGIYALQSLSVQRGLPDGPLEPLWLTWFLAALFVWRLTVPLWKRLRWPLTAAIAISLFGGLAATGDALGISRIISLLPFFVAGLLLEKRHFALLRAGWVKAGSAVLMVATFILCYAYLEQLSREWIYWRESLTDRDVDILPVGLPGRVAFLLLAFALTAAFLSLTPRRTTWYTRLGALTMYVFLLHGLVIRISDQFGWYDYSNAVFGPHGSFAVNLLLSIPVTLALCSPWVRRATRWAVEPSVGWAIRRGTGQGAPSGSGPSGEARRLEYAAR